MKRVLLLTVMLLAGCDRGGSHGQALAPVGPLRSAPPSTETINQLIADPDALANAHRRCKARAADATPEL